MKKQVLFIHGAGEGAYEADKPLAASLQAALGPAYQVHYPRMRDEESPEYTDWKAHVTSELAALNGEVTLVGHSVGGSVLIKYLSEQAVEKRIACLVLLAAPYWGADDFWKWDAAQLPEDAAAKLASIPRIFIYHCRDDASVPFAHLARYAARLPKAAIRAVDRGGHQFANGLADVTEDIRNAESTSFNVDYN